MANTRKKKERASGWWGRVPGILKNRYAITFACFMVYLTFFDHYSLIKRHQLDETLRDLQEEKAQYAAAIEEAQTLEATIKADGERFARERYYMKRADEDVYITK